MLKETDTRCIPVGTGNIQSRRAVDDLESHYHGDMRMYQTSPCKCPKSRKKPMGIANPLEKPTQLHIVSTPRNGRLSTKLLAETVSLKNQSVSNVVEPNGS